MYQQSYEPATYYSIDVECVATGTDHNSRSVGQIALVDQYERVGGRTAGAGTQQLEERHAPRCLALCILFGAYDTCLAAAGVLQRA